MYARTSSWCGTPEALETWAAHVAAHVAPFVAGLPGNAGCVFLIDREGRTGVTLTLWDSEDAALESDRHAEQSLGEHRGRDRGRADRARTLRGARAGVDSCHTRRHG